MPVVCTNCQYTMFFSAVGAGLFDAAGLPKNLPPPEVQPEQADS
jgi:hypothetical protein